MQGATKIVKVIIEHPNYMAGEERIKRRARENDPFFRTEEKSQFSPDVTPLILAAQYNNHEIVQMFHEIVQMFLSRDHTIERPHIISCQCVDCVTKQNYDSLKRLSCLSLSTPSVTSSTCIVFHGRYTVCNQCWICQVGWGVRTPGQKRREGKGTQEIFDKSNTVCNYSSYSL